MEKCFPPFGIFEKHGQNARKKMHKIKTLAFASDYASFNDFENHCFNQLKL